MAAMSWPLLRTVRSALAQMDTPEEKGFRRIKIQHFQNTALLRIKYKVHLIPFLMPYYFNVS